MGERFLDDVDEFDNEDERIESTEQDVYQSGYRAGYDEGYRDGKNDAYAEKNKR